jgi:endo-1,4-beta-xylanase
MIFKLVAALAAMLIANPAVAAAGNGVDLLAGQDWSHFAGAGMSGDSVNITSLNRKLVNQDGSGGQANPPVNAHGPHLSVRGNFSVSATMQHAASGATLQFYGQLPRVYDEWRAEGTSMSVTTVDGKELLVQVWDGTSDSPAETKTFDVPLTNDAMQLTMARKGGWINLTLDGQHIGSLRDHKIFAGKNLWFGADNSSNEPWVLQALSANGLGSGRVSLEAPEAIDIVHNDPNSLRNLAADRARPLLIGAAVAHHPLAADSLYRQTAVTEFSIFTPENDFKPQFVHPMPQTYDFTEGDNIVELAQANDIQVHGHTLVFGEANPRWMQDTPVSQRQQVMLDHIANVVGHWRGAVAEWDVVNEPLSDDPADFLNKGDGLRKHLWWQAMGEQYIDQAFRAAHLADPGAKLYINEYGIEHDGQRWDALLGLLSRLQQRGVPIDGVGFQAHVYRPADHIEPAVLRQHIQALSSLGLMARISEIDVHGDNKTVQAQQYAQTLEACQSEPNCSSFTTWGISDLYGSTTVSHAYPLALGDDLIWRANFKPKPAYGALQNVLRQ